MADYPYNYPGYPQGLKYPWEFPMPSAAERDRRWSTLRSALTQENIECLIVGGVSGYIFFPNNYIYYLSNYIPIFNPGTFVIFPANGEPRLVINNSLGPQFWHFAGATSWIKEIKSTPDPAKEIENILKALKIQKHHIGIIGYNSGVFPAVIYDSLRQELSLAKFMDATPILVKVMNELSRTSTEEMEFLKKACGIHDASYQAVVKALKPGVTEKELWAAAEGEILKNGGWFPHFMLATSGPRPTFVRSPPSSNKLNKGDIVMFETNVIYGGVLSQIAYTIALGQPDRQIQEMFAFCSELYSQALAELEKRRTFGEIEKALVDRIHQAGYEPMTPQMHIYNASGSMPANSPPQPGDYFTVHPNFGDKTFTSGAKFGDCVRVNKQGKIERLQKTPAKLNIIKV